ncbi:hypothetical protein [uncultured Paraglaciecola sp.]|uniref:IS66 family insertion sequence element accessory protein TnpA n=1 Tax=uncultured Paraglaciecola sp. TaxID=1765024 RepID=UPI00262386BF|nr:hypothetical protein [uncultured Paraglaciecola sp.]
MALPRDQQEHIEAWQSSGLSQVAYCRQHKLNSKTFSNWLRIYRFQQVSSVAPTLIPVEITSQVSSSGMLCLRCPQGHTLELPADVSPQWLSELLKCLD